MLTDDDLTRQLESAFRESSSDLRYAGRVPAVRRAPSAGWLAVPAVATVAALALVASAGEIDQPAPEAAPSETATTPPRTVTETVTVAGYTFTYRHAPGEQLVDDLHADLSPSAPPNDATAITGAPPEVQAWVGTDPDSGQHALWVEAPTRNHGRLFALLSPTWSEDQLTDLFLNGRPRTVPAVG